MTFDLQQSQQFLMIQTNSTKFGGLISLELPALEIASYFQIQVIVSLTVQNISLYVLNSIFDYLFKFQSHKVIKIVPCKCLPLVLRNKTWQKYPWLQLFYLIFSPSYSKAVMNLVLGVCYYSVLFYVFIAFVTCL